MLEKLGYQTKKLFFQLVNLGLRLLSKYRFYQKKYKLILAYVDSFVLAKFMKEILCLHPTPKDKEYTFSIDKTERHHKFLKEEREIYDVLIVFGDLNLVGINLTILEMEKKGRRNS